MTKFVTKCKIGPGRQETIEFPSMTYKLLAPERVVVTEVTQDGQEVAAKEVTCKINCGGAEIVNASECYFTTNNTFNLIDFSQNQKRGGDLTVFLTNKTHDPKTYNVSVVYTECRGVILYQQKCDRFEKVLKDIYAAGTCTRLVFSFNRKVKELQIRPTTEVDQQEAWISGLEIDVQEDPAASYTIDFTDELAVYPQFLNYLQIVAEDTNCDEQREPLYIYIMAYGFPRRA
jgi:hypothetical protein